VTPSRHRCVPLDRQVRTKELTNRRSDRPRKVSQQQASLTGYFALSCFLCGGATELRDLWVHASTFDFGFVLAVYLAAISPWVLMTISLLQEAEWNKYLVLPFYAPTVLLIYVQVMNLQIYGKALAFVQIALAVILALLVFGVRREMGTDDDRGGIA